MIINAKIWKIIPKCKLLEYWYFIAINNKRENFFNVCIKIMKSEKNYFL